MTWLEGRQQERAGPDLEKVRRFALAVGLVLITYSVAAVALDTGETIHTLGIPLKINRPEYLGVGLAIASVWGVLRFLYYGVWKTRSPARKRKEELTPLVALRPARQQGDVEGYLDAIRSHLPRLPGAKISAKLTPEHPTEGRVESPEDRFFVDPVIPRIFYVAARIEDVDYFAPIWVNVIALSLWLWRITCAGS